MTYEEETRFGELLGQLLDADRGSSRSDEIVEYIFEHIKDVARRAYYDGYISAEMEHASDYDSGYDDGFAAAAQDYDDGYNAGYEEGLGDGRDECGE